MMVSGMAGFWRLVAGAKTSVRTIIGDESDTNKDGCWPEKKFFASA
jgi:hypothetical protein